MPVVLLPPITGGLGLCTVAEPLAEGPRFVRTAGMGRWHRPRSGQLWADGRETYSAWCGYSVGGLRKASLFLGVNDIPNDLPVCATCDGRAVGAGQETDGPEGRTLLFSPRWLTPPTKCPGSRTGLFEQLPGGAVGRCLACGDHHPLRAMGGPYASRYAIVQHPPGPALVGPCAYHRWRWIVRDDTGLRCGCGRTLTAS